MRNVKSKLFSDLQLLLVLLCVLIPMVSAHGQIPAVRELRIGFVLPLSGEWAFLGAGIRDGALLALNDLQQRGRKVQLLFEDNQGALAASASIATRLIQRERVDALVSIISGVVQVLKPLATRAEVLNVGICSDTDVPDGKYNFINYLTAEQGVARYLSHFTKQYGANKSLGVFALNESGFQRILAELERQGNGKIRISFRASFNKGMSDFHPLLLRARQVSIEALLVLGLSPEIELLARQAKAIKYEVPLTSIESFGLASDKSAFEGAWFVDSAVPSAEFRSRFLKTYGREVTPGVGHAYDTVMLLAQAYEKAATVSTGFRSEFARRFRAISEYRGVLGALRVRDDGVIWSDASIKRIKSGVPVLVEE